jgi:hypothetical protein
MHVFPSLPPFSRLGSLLFASLIWTIASPGLANPTIYRLPTIDAEVGSPLLVIGVAEPTIAVSYLRPKTVSARTNACGYAVFKKILMPIGAGVPSIQVGHGTTTANQTLFLNPTDRKTQPIACDAKTKQLSESVAELYWRELTPATATTPATLEVAIQTTAAHVTMQFDQFTKRQVKASKCGTILISPSSKYKQTDSEGILVHLPGQTLREVGEFPLRTTPPSISPTQFACMVRTGKY